MFLSLCVCYYLYLEWFSVSVFWFCFHYESNNQDFISFHLIFFHFDTYTLRITRKKKKKKTEFFLLVGWLSLNFFCFVLFSFEFIINLYALHNYGTNEIYIHWHTYVNDGKHIHTYTRKARINQLREREREREKRPWEWKNKKKINQ